MRDRLLLLVFCFIGFTMHSQNKINISGKVLDDATQVPIEAATVYLTSVADSTVVDYTITDKSGNFLLTTQKITKPFFLKVSIMGYKTYQQKRESLTQAIDFGTIKLEEDSNLLKEVIVKGEAPPIRIKNDTLEFNASSFKVRPDANVEALLKQLPGVEIDAEGKITVNGKEVNQVLVNGKPFFDKDGKIALQNLPSDIINKVQISDSKTKKEELAGQAASSNNSSINLTIDEKKNKGFFGKVMGGFGTEDRYESSLLFNYFKDKLKLSVLASSNNINSTGFSMNEIFDSMGGGRNSSIYTSDNGSFGINGMRFGGGNGITQSNMAGFNYADEWFKGTDANASYFYTEADTRNVNRTKEVNLLPEGIFTTESNSVTNDFKYAHNFNSEIELKIDSTQSIFVSPKFVKAKSVYNRSSDEISTNEDNDVLNTNITDGRDETDTQNFSTNIYYNKSFKRKGRALSIWFDSENNKEESINFNNSHLTLYADPDGDGDFGISGEVIRNQKRFRADKQNDYGFGIDFTEPIKDSIFIKAGVSYGNNLMRTDRTTFNFDESTGTYSDLDEELTNFLQTQTMQITPFSGFNIDRKKYQFYTTLGTSIREFGNLA
ncbi:MAG TPA: carboxypeptidase-like regulatory domain-containing protein, partial [Flavobacterium sp.]